MPLDTFAYEWLTKLKVNSWSIEVNEHAASYRTVTQWLDENPTWFEHTPAPLLAEMKQAETICRLQIYPDTPVGFLCWYGPTLDSVITQARAYELEWNPALRQS